MQLTILLHHFEVLVNHTPVCQAALQSPITDIEDAILYHLALHHRLDYFVTENIKDFKKGALPSLPVITASQLLRLL
ncbi:MAG: hypothetical protein M3342_04885 [Bacteroidota bacterium]|nr:hypothetical protein [Flavisolibacter sp.]MBD0285642.1 hypothetical protein [Flavisolibacter sp.]MBD0352575.1 hypothetical protein [Flavisolibacter sp.]MBD0368077.1 hypothetical protein [Flavisolibacter sp.]MDQ3843332.1 hypothetical protein [Bacteroidota bacterium]